MDEESKISMEEIRASIEDYDPWPNLNWGESPSDNVLDYDDELDGYDYDEDFYDTNSTHI